VPVYEQLVVDGAIKTAPLGGVDLTRYMGDMLLSCKVLLQCRFGHSVYS
jgi:actin-related protein